MNDANIWLSIENEIWAGFGPVSSTEKKNLADYEQLLRAFFSCFHQQKNLLKFFFKSILASCH